MDNSNIPFGFEDPGLKTKQTGKAQSADLEDKKFREQFKGFPQTSDEAEAMKYKLSQDEKALDHENIS